MRHFEVDFNTAGKFGKRDLMHVIAYDNESPVIEGEQVILDDPEGLTCQAKVLRYWRNWSDTCNVVEVRYDRTTFVESDVA